jgi:hypothetical protein
MAFAILLLLLIPASGWVTTQSIVRHSLVLAASNRSRSRYDLGLGKNQAFDGEDIMSIGELTTNATLNWVAPLPVHKQAFVPEETPAPKKKKRMKPQTVRKLIARDEDSRALRAALWDEEHYDETRKEERSFHQQPISLASVSDPIPVKFYPDIDLSIPESVYKDDGSVDVIWDLLRWEAEKQAQREPLLVSYLYSTILNHKTLESALAFLLANRLQSPAMMISTQLNSIILETLDNDPFFRRSLRADIMVSSK